MIRELPRLSLRRRRNLGDIVVDAKSREEGGTSGPCGKCKLCESMRQTEKFCGSDGREYEVRGKFNCESVGMVYAMHCEVCEHIIYVGKSQNSLRERFYGHRRDFTIRHQDKPVAHFMQDDHNWEDMRVVGVERVRGGDDVVRVVCKQFWIGKLGTLQEENRQW
jgi:hypothetical protein